MSTLIVTAHPDVDSLTLQAARRLHDLLGPGEATLAHLAQEGFDPRFTTDDRRDYLAQSRTDAGIRAEQDRVDRADHLALVFPVYWWSMPALLKGWIDRVFIGGWAFAVDGERVVPRLERLTAHLLPVSGTAQESFERHGYAASFSTQIDHGIFDYCGIRRGATAFIRSSESGDRGVVSRDLEAAATTVAAAITGR